MISDIKLFKRYGSSVGVEAWSFNEHDFSIEHRTYRGLIDKINTLINNNVSGATILRIWQKRDGKSTEITQQTYTQISPSEKVCVLLNLESGSSAQESSMMVSIMEHIKERMDGIESREKRIEKLVNEVKEFTRRR